MATPPTLVTEVEPAVGWASTATPKTSPSVTVAVGDVLVVVASVADEGTLSTPTNSGTAHTWTQRQNLSTASNCRVAIWTTVATVAQAMTVTLARTSGSQAFSFTLFQFRGSDGVGASSSSNTAGTNTQPTLSITAGAANSAVVSTHADWNAVDAASRVWATVNGSVMTEAHYYRGTSDYSTMSGYRIDAGAAGAKSVGLTGTGTAAHAWTNAAIEILGSSGATPSPVNFKQFNRTAIRRAANW